MDDMDRELADLTKSAAKPAAEPVMRERAEIIAMKKRVADLSETAVANNRNPMFPLLLMMLALSALDWTLGKLDNEKFEDIFRKTNRERGD